MERLRNPVQYIEVEKNKDKDTKKGKEADSDISSIVDSSEAVEK